MERLLSCNACGLTLREVQAQEPPWQACEKGIAGAHHFALEERREAGNPKDVAGANKLPLHLWPGTASAVGCLAFLSGALKYGRNNWRATQVLASVYISALKRHAEGYYEGEDIDPDEGIPHLSGVLACAAILVDAKAAGTLIDDRQFPGGYRSLVGELTPHVERLKKLHEGKSPKHYAISDGIAIKIEKAAEKIINVVVGVIVDTKAKTVLLQRRALDDENFPGKWECPGGTVERDETDNAALCRELHEELGVKVRNFYADAVWCGQIQGYKGLRHSFRFYRVDVDGSPRALDGQPEIAWKTIDEASELAITPANMLAWPEIHRLVEGVSR
jgi:mutator protein MutT